MPSQYLSLFLSILFLLSSLRLFFETDRRRRINALHIGMSVSWCLGIIYYTGVLFFDSFNDVWYSSILSPTQYTFWGAYWFMEAFISKTKLYKTITKKVSNLWT